MKLTNKQKIAVFVVLLFAFTWAGGLIGFLVIIALFILAVLIDKRKRK